MAQKIFGNTLGTPNDVSLLKDSKGIGDSLSVHLSQQAGSTAVWTIDVFVHCQQGTFWLGQKTTPVLTNAIPHARTVIIANCPGATGWKLICTCTTEGEEAEIVLDSSHCCSNAIGVVAVNDPASNATDVTIVGPLPLPVVVASSVVVHTIVDSGSVALSGPSNILTPWTNTFSTALANSFVVKAAAGTLRNLTVRVDGTLASGTYYLQLWNLAALPADATVVGAGNGLEAPVKVVHVLGTDDLVVYDFAELGIPFTAGAVLGLSSTEFVKTAVAGTFCSVIGGEYR